MTNKALDVDPILTELIEKGSDLFQSIRPFLVSDLNKKTQIPVSLIDDVLQEAFIKYLKYIKENREQAVMKGGYLRAFVRNVARNFRKSTLREDRKFTPQPFDEVKGGLTTNQAGVRSYVLEMVMDLIAHCKDERHAQILQLHLLEGYSMAKTQKITGIPKTSFHRCRKEAMDWIQERLHENGFGREDLT